jgi:hypothetical protein
MKKVTFYFSFFALILLLSNCGSPKATKIDEFNLTIDLPAGWKMNKDNFRGQLTIEISNAGRRVMSITEANPSIESLEMLVKASSKAFKVLKEESFAGGFGVTLQTKKKKQFRYYVQKDGKQIRFEPAAYYKDTDLNRCIELIKSAK